MNLRHKAAALVLSCNPQDIGTQLEMLEKAAEEKELFPPSGVEIWQPFENDNLDYILETIDDYEREFKEVWNTALDTAVANVDADIEWISPNGMSYGQDMLEEGKDYEVGINRSSILEHKK